MIESERVQRWRDAKREQGFEPLTIWVSHEEKARFVDLAQHWHRSPSELLREGPTGGTLRYDAIAYMSFANNRLGLL